MRLGLVLCFAFLTVESVVVPENPCPRVFQYARNNQGDIYGTVQFQNDGSGNYELSVNVSLATLLTNNRNIKLELLTPVDNLRNGANPSYNIYFPSQNVLPRPTLITFNGRVYCSGPPDRLVPGGGVTNLWATTFLKTFTTNNNNYNNFNNNFNNFNNIPVFQLPGNPFFARPSEAPPVSSSTSVVTRPRPRPISTTPSAPPSTSVGFNPFTTDDPDIDIRTRPHKEIQCGTVANNYQPLVFNGESIKDGEYPWLVAIMVRLGLDYKFRCGASLITDRHAITAGHCVWYGKVPLFPSSDLLLIMGKNSIVNWANRATIRNAQSVTIHPNYKEKSADGDIALITFDTSVEFHNTVRPLCLWEADNELSDIVGKLGTVVGWGSDGRGSESVTEPKKVELPVVDHEECLRANRTYIKLTSNRTFCAGNSDGKLGLCSGDNGGGFIMQVDGRWTLRGVVSRVSSTSKCDVENYFIFADVAMVIDWVKQMVT